MGAWVWELRLDGSFGTLDWQHGQWYWGEPWGHWMEPSLSLGPGVYAAVGIKRKSPFALASPWVSGALAVPSSCPWQQRLPHWVLAMLLSIQNWAFCSQSSVGGSSTSSGHAQRPCPCALPPQIHLARRCEAHLLKPHFARAPPDQTAFRSAPSALHPDTDTFDWHFQWHFCSNLAGPWRAMCSSS